MTEEQSSERSGSKLTNYAIIGGLILAIIVFLLGNGFYYNEVYKSKILSYNIFPSYDLGNQFFTGIVIENRGRVLLTDVEVILSDLESDIVKISIPGPHQSINIVEGGEGTKELRTMMPRFSQGTFLHIYIITSEPITLAAEETLFVTSSEVVGRSSEEISNNPFWQIIPVIIAGVLFLASLIRVKPLLKKAIERIRMGDLVILSATYGTNDNTKDVTQILNSKILFGKLDLPVRNENLGGDPIHGEVKKLEVEYSYAGNIHNKVVDEKNVLILP